MARRQIYADSSLPLFGETDDVCPSQIAGVDEAGRGPLAGPVVTAAVILDPANVPEGLNDSKVLSAARRDELYAEIMATATVSIAMASAATIDRINIRAATLAAMTRAVARLERRPVLALIDGRDIPPGLACGARAIVQGDATIAAIAAASIIAKVTRDRLMVRMAQVYPDYGFEQHMGYGTARHQAALAKYGPCALHRRSFAPIRALVAAA